MAKIVTAVMGMAIMAMATIVMAIMAVAINGNGYNHKSYSGNGNDYSTSGDDCDGYYGNLYHVKCQYW